MAENEKIETRFCTSCIYCKTEPCQYNRDRVNLYCHFNDKPTNIDYFVEKNQMVEKKHWCPLNGILGTKKVLSYKERREKWDAITPITKWEDLQVGTVYHVPPIMDEKRKDIIITSIFRSGANYAQYRILGEKENCCYTYYTMYPSTLMSKFLVPHKIKDVKAIKNY